MSNSKVLYNILVFPGGTENGLEIYKSLRYCKEVKLFSVSSNVVNHAEYVFENHFEISSVYDETWIAELNQIINENKIDYVFPSNDIVIDALNEERESINAPIILPSQETVKILRSKKSTYAHFPEQNWLPKVFSEENIELPAFARPDDGYGSQGVLKISKIQDIPNNSSDYILTEFLPGEEYSIDCLSGADHKLLYCQGRTRERIRMGTTMHSEFVSKEMNELFVEIAEMITTSYHMVGAWFFQMKKDQNNELRLLEISPRIAGTMCFNRVKGVNFSMLSIYIHDGKIVSTLCNHNNFHIDRSLKNRYKSTLEFDKIYVDLDDTIVIHAKLNTQLLTFLFQCINKKKRIVLITKSLETDLNAFLQEMRIDRLFDEIIHLKEEDKKSNYIEPNSKSIFIDDSFSQREEVALNCNIPTFDPSMIEVLMDDKL